MPVRMEAVLIHINGEPAIEMRLLEDDVQGALVLSTCTIDGYMLRRVLWGQETEATPQVSHRRRSADAEIQAAQGEEPEAV